MRNSREVYGEINKKILISGDIISLSHLKRRCPKRKKEKKRKKRPRSRGGEWKVHV